MKIWDISWCNLSANTGSTSLSGALVEKSEDGSKVSVEFVKPSATALQNNEDYFFFKCDSSWNAYRIAPLPPDLVPPGNDEPIAPLPPPGEDGTTTE